MTDQSLQFAHELRREAEADDTRMEEMMKEAEQAACMLAFYGCHVICGAKSRLGKNRGKFPDMDKLLRQWGLGHQLLIALEEYFEPASPDLSSFADARRETMHLAVRSFCGTVVSSWQRGERSEVLKRLAAIDEPDVQNVYARLSAERREWQKSHTLQRLSTSDNAERNRQASSGCDNVMGQTGGKTDLDQPDVFVFCPNGDGYYIEAFGESGQVLIEDAEGLHDIFRLIQTPNMPVEMLELKFGGPVKSFPGEKRTEQQMADAETVKNLKAEKARLRGEIESADNETESADSQRRLDEVTEAGRKMFDHAGRPRNMNDQWGAPRSAIRKRLNNAYIEIAIHGLPKLAKQLKPSISAKGDSYVYQPGDRPPAWQFSEKIEN